MEEWNKSDTIHLLLGAGVAASLLGLIGYAAMQNRYAAASENVLDRHIPGYTDQLVDELFHRPVLSPRS